MRWRWRWPRRRRGKPSLVWIAGGSYGLLIAAAMALVLGLSVRANYQNTVSLLNEKAVLANRSIEAGLRSYLDPVERAVGSLQQIYAEAPIDPMEEPTLSTALLAALVSVPAIERLVVSVPGRGEFGAVKEGDRKPRVFGWQPSSARPADALLQAEGDGTAPVWGPMVQTDAGIFANVSAPLVRDGAVRGTLTAATSTEFLSRIVRDLDAGSDETVFALAGDTHVIAYSDLDDVASRRPDGRRLPMPVALFGDPVLAKMADAATLRPFTAAREAGVDVRQIDAEGESYVAMTRKIAGYGLAEWTVGAYYRGGSIGREMRRLVGSGLIGLATLVFAIGLSFHLARRLARPLTRMADESRRVAALEFDKIERLPENSVREVDQLVQSFNAMAVGLRALNTYVPKSLFRKLMRLGLAEATRSREVELTILFTDIAGFTAQSEGMGAAEAAAFLNRHFAVLVEAVEAEGGTVDKFLGDGMLAFWGAPDERADHAEAAVRAAAAIVEAQRAANRTAAADGSGPTRLRIGVHTGRVIVGNIGAFDRVDYTIIGDAVNVAERLQELGRIVAAQDDVVVLASEMTLEKISEAVPRRQCGRHTLRGRRADVEVWRLFEGSAGANGEPPHM